MENKMMSDKNRNYSGKENNEKDNKKPRISLPNVDVTSDSDNNGSDED